MKMKLAAMGLILSAVCALPVLAHAGGGHGSTAGRRGNTSNAHGLKNVILATGFTCDDDDEFFEDGGFARWVNNHGYQFEFGQTLETTGLRLEPGNRTPKSFKVDWDLTEADNPFFVVYVSDPSNGIFRWDTDSAWSPGTGFTVTELSNGFTRFFYDAAVDGLESPYRWNNIYFFDYDPGSYEAMRNVFVNGIPVTPNLNSKYPQIDCTVQAI